jgi:CBS domain-containing protein
MGARVREVMSTSVLTTTPDTKAVDAALVVALRDITALPVLAGGRVVGMFSQADLLAAPASKPQRTVTVGEVMSPLTLVTTPEADCDALATAMTDKAVASVPVLDQGDLVGIVTRRDVSRRGAG